MTTSDPDAQAQMRAKRLRFDRYVLDLDRGWGSWFTKRSRAEPITRTSPKSVVVSIGTSVGTTDSSDQCRDSCKSILSIGVQWAPSEAPAAFGARILLRLVEVLIFALVLSVLSWRRPGDPARRRRRCLLRAIRPRLHYNYSNEEKISSSWW